MDNPIDSMIDNDSLQTLRNGTPEPVTKCNLKRKKIYHNRLNDSSEWLNTHTPFQGGFYLWNFDLVNHVSLFKWMLTLKSRMSANMYGPPWDSFRLGFIISDKITESSPYFPRNSFAHSIPSWPKPPTKHWNMLQTKWFRILNRVLASN